jgi:hypothetical protein
VQHSSLELFRRAICERDEFAWSTIVDEYSQLVRVWIRQHPVTYQLHENHDDLVCGSFARFWAAVKPERWEHFCDLASVLRYLKLCAHSQVLDAARAARPWRTVPLDDLVDESTNGLDVEADLIDAMGAAELWQLVLEALSDESEQLVAYLSFVREVPPAQISARHPQLFPNAAAVYRVKRNILDRLRRGRARSAPSCYARSAERP